MKPSKTQFVYAGFLALLVAVVGGIASSSLRAQKSETDQTAAQLAHQGAEALANGQFVEALRFAQRASDLEPREPAFLITVARLQARLGAVEPALLSLRRLRELQPNNPDGYLPAALLLRDTDRPQEAIALLSNGLELRASPAELAAQLGFLQLSLNRPQQALETSISELDNFPNAAELQLVAGLALQNIPERRVDAIPYFQRALDEGSPQVRQRSHLELGSLLLEMGSGETAVEHLRQARELSPDSAEVHYKLSAALRTVGDSAGAAEALKTFQRLSQAHDRQERIAKEIGARLNEIQVLAGQNRLAEAAAQVNDFLAEYPKHAPALALRSKISFSSHEVADALISIRRAQQLQAGRVEYHFLEGVYSLAARQPEQAQAALERALALDPELGEAHEKLGILAANAGKLEEAIDHFDRALALGTDNIYLRLNYAEILERLGRTEESPPAGRFVESSQSLGVHFTHRHFGTGEKYMPENMGPGVALFDFDADGRLDLYFPQGAPLADAPPEPSATNRLFQQQPDGTFQDVTASAGVGDRGYGMGASYADYDGDSDLDLYVTNFGPNVLYRNKGDGSFESVTQPAGVGGDTWSAGSGFFDADGDGDLDLFVVNYVDFDYNNHKWCGSAQRKIRSYCHPDVYNGQPDVLYRNLGNGRFEEAGKSMGLLATRLDKGLGLALADLDEDGRQDVYVANDSTMNYLYLGQADGTFAERALLAGVGFNVGGQAEAGMGIALGDIDGDGRTDLFVTHLDQETNTLYKNQGDATFVDVTERAGLAAPSLPWVGFGTAMLDHDNDGDLDIFVADGHIIDNIQLFDPARSHRQPLLLLDNRGDGTFVDISNEIGVDQLLVGRGVAAGDLDLDGDLDLVVTQNNDRALVLLNQVGSRNHSIAFRLHSPGPNTHALGARIEIFLGASKQVREISGASSYLSQHAPEIYFGVGSHRLVDQVEVRWPSGATQRFVQLPGGFLYTLTEGNEQPTASQAFSK